MTAPHWLDDEPPAASEPELLPDAPLPPLAIVASRLARVSPDWAARTVDPPAAPSTQEAVLDLGSDRAQGVESIREGWLLHRGASRLVTGASPDLALLVGDWCYADGLCTIADHGSLDDVAALARLVAQSAARGCDDGDDDPLEQRWPTTIQELHHG